MTVASDTREAVRNQPFLRTALRAGVVNYSAAARFIDVGEEEAVVAALRRYADELPPYEPSVVDARVDMQSGLGPGAADEALLTVGDLSLVADEGNLTAVVATGAVGPRALGEVLARLAVEELTVEATAASDGHLVVVVSRRAGVDALRHVESALKV